MTQNNSQWFAITVIGGKEDSIIESLREKIYNFGYNEYVTNIKVFKTKKITENIFTKTDPKLPKNLHNTKTTTWETLPNGSYKRTKTKVVNKFPGYVFIKMENLDEKLLHSIWFCIRNTNGVLGFVGSSGKGVLPIPISISEYENISNEPQQKQVQPEVAENTNIQVNEEADQVIDPVVDEQPKKVYTCNYKVGNTVKINSGSFIGESGEVKNIDLEKGKVTIQIEIFGRITTIELNLDQVEIE